jgi:hypothetical protein
LSDDAVPSGGRNECRHGRTRSRAARGFPRDGARDHRLLVALAGCRDRLDRGLGGPAPVRPGLGDDGRHPGRAHVHLFSACRTSPYRAFRARPWRRPAYRGRGAGWPGCSGCCFSSRPSSASSTRRTRSPGFLTKDIGPPTALIMQRIAAAEEPPEPQSDEALAEIDRVILRDHGRASRRGDAHVGSSDAVL